MINPQVHACVRCPASAMCEADEICMLKSYPARAQSCSDRSKQLEGDWVADDSSGEYRLRDASCPSGYRLVNSFRASGKFSHDA